MATSNAASDLRDDAIALRDLPLVARTLAGVKPFPAVVAQVRELAANPRCAPAEVARLVEADVGLVTDLLRVVNAPASGLAQRCTSIGHAVSLLGLRRVSDVVTGAAALSLVEEATVAHPALAGHAIAVAGVARLLASIVGLSPEEAFTVGLLHDVGAMLIAQTGDSFYEELVEKTTPGAEPTVEDERAVMGFDHGALGAEVLRQWHLPQPLPRVIELHHRWDEAKVAELGVAAMVALVRVSETLVAATGMYAAPTLLQIEGIMEEPAFAFLGLKRDEISNLWPALMRTSDKGFIIGGGVDPTAGEAELAKPGVAVVPAPAPEHASFLRAWLAVFALVTAALVGLLFLAHT